MEEVRGKLDAIAGYDRMEQVIDTLVLLTNALDAEEQMFKDHL
jgi:hypothetical protein